MWLTHAVDGIARRIVGDREETLSERVGLPPTHVGED
jgi:hypothetical protein